MARSYAVYPMVVLHVPGRSFTVKANRSASLSREWDERARNLCVMAHACGSRVACVDILKLVGHRQNELVCRARLDGVSPEPAPLAEAVV